MFTTWLLQLRYDGLYERFRCQLYELVSKENCGTQVGIEEILSHSAKQHAFCISESLASEILQPIIHVLTARHLDALSMIVAAQHVSSRSMRRYTGCSIFALASAVASARLEALRL